ncbi:hypothetical protein OKW34_003173 [Paraburkholderia youngii]
MSLEREVLPDQAEAGEKSLRALRVTKSAHAPLTFTRRLMTILCPVVHPGRSLDERMFLQQDVEFGAVLVDCPPKQIRLTERNEDFVKMPCAARFAASSFDAMCEARAEFVAPAADRLVTDNDTALEQQFFNITQAKLEPQLPPNRETNDCRREPVAMIKRFSFLHRDILRDYLANVTVPDRANRRFLIKIT